MSSPNIRDILATSNNKDHHRDDGSNEADESNP
jgi:hypothetical protein